MAFPRITVCVVMIGGTNYWPLTRPFIENYCERHGYEFRVFTEDCMPADGHPAWNKLIVPSFAKTPHVVVWDADLVPMPWAPPIHLDLRPNQLGMVRIEPSSTGRMKLRERYGKKAGPALWFNSGLISVPHDFKPILRDLFFSSDYNESIFWEQGALNNFCYVNRIPVAEIDSRWNCWVSSRIEDYHIETQHALHFAKGSTRRMRNIGRMYRMLRLSGRLPSWVSRN